MIPPFDSSGYLPPGIHPASLDEIDARFGRSSELRRVQMESIRWMVEMALRAGVQRIVLNGSFLTDIIEPNDVDCALLFLPHKQRKEEAVDEIMAGLPFLDVAIAEVEEFEDFVDDVFATDRYDVPKGMIEVIL